MTGHALVFAGLLASIVSMVGTDETCRGHVFSECSKPGSMWTEGPCTSMLDNFPDNEFNLKSMVGRHFRDSFTLLLMASHFSSDEVNRFGVHQMLQGFSDKFWDHGKNLMKYVLKRGGRFSKGDGQNALLMEGLEAPELAQGEVQALATTLDIFKKNAKIAVVAHKHSLNKKVRNADGDNYESYDPSVAHYIEKHLLDEYTDDIRSVAGKLNILGKMARNDRTRAMGLHLFDENLS